MRGVTIVRRAIFCAATIVCIAGSVMAQSSIEDALKQYTGPQAEGYMQPFADLAGGNLNSGWYHTASIGQMGFFIEFDFVVMGGMVGDDQKSYDLPLPSGYSAATMKAPTIFGDAAGTTYRDPVSGLTYIASGGVINTSILPALAPQLTIGNVLGTRAMIRFLATPKIEDIDVDLLGLGLQHSVSQWFPGIPLDVAAGVFYTKASVGDIIDYSGLAIGAQASKEFGIATVYGGFQWEQATMDIKYTYTGSAPGSSQVNISLDAESAVRATVGGSLSLGVFKLFADVNVGAVTVFSGGFGFGM